MSSGQHTAWLSRLAVEKKRIDFPDSIVRGRPFSSTVNFAADLSGDTFASAMRLAPDAEGEPLEAFTIEVGAFADGITPVTFSLTAEQTGADGNLPADGDADGLAWVVFDIIHAPVGFDPYRIGGGELPISGRVT